jgi:hypothetical protein
MTVKQLGFECCQVVQKPFALSFHVPLSVWPDCVRGSRVILPLGVNVILNLAPPGVEALKGSPSKKVAWMSFGAIGSAAKAVLAVRSMLTTANGPARIEDLPWGNHRSPSADVIGSECMCFPRSRRPPYHTIVPRFASQQNSPPMALGVVAVRRSTGILALPNTKTACLRRGKVSGARNPLTLPVQAPAKYELVVNLKTAKAVGLEVPA